MIRTARFVLRPLAAGDVTATYMRWLRDPEVRRWIDYAAAAPSESVLRAYVESKRLLPGCWFLGIYTPDGEHLGNVKAEPDGQGGHHLGILLGEPAWRGRGVAVEVMRALCLLVQQGSQCIWLGVAEQHTAGRRAYAKAGFQWVRTTGGICRYEWPHGDGKPKKKAMK